MRDLVLATGNPGKAREIAPLLAPLGWRVRTLAELGLAAPPETGTSYLENALLKARAAAAASGLPALAEDSGLEVDALGGAPGIYSARFAGPGADDAANRTRLLDALCGVATAQRTARFRCAAVYLARADDPWPRIGLGTWEGHIAAAPAGTGGFGYDPLFLPAGGTGTAAELSPAHKEAASHRGQALRVLIAQLRPRAGG
jgi:XTP/dITP diphosphohydrolase